MQSVGSVTSQLRLLLATSQNADGGWPYYAGRHSRLEPTSWALIALGDAKAASLLESWRSPSRLVVEPTVGSVNYAFNALAALALATTAAESSRQTAADIARQLLAHRGERVSKHEAIRQDPDLQGWSWTDGTFSWVEPTAWCLLAVKKLARQHSSARSRIDEAERLLADRACDGGGWNTGNPEVYGQRLSGYVPPTALALLALQDRPTERMVSEAVAYLNVQGIREGSTTALALSWLALTALGMAADPFADRLVDRLPVAASLGNLAVAALMLYVLESRAHDRRPTAFLV